MKRTIIFLGTILALLSGCQQSSNTSDINKILAEDHYKMMIEDEKASYMCDFIHKEDLEKITGVGIKEGRSGRLTISAINDDFCTYDIDKSAGDIKISTDPRQVSAIKDFFSKDTSRDDIALESDVGVGDESLLLTYFTELNPNKLASDLFFSRNGTTMHLKFFSPPGLKPLGKDELLKIGSIIAERI